MSNVQSNLQAPNNSRTSATQAHETSILAYNGSNITFELSNGEVMVNLTEMAKAFGKRPNDFLGLSSTDQLVSAITKKSGIARNQIVRTVRGGDNPGTWANRLIALSFAQWLSVDFHLICLEKIEELLTQGVATTSNDDEAILHAMQVLQRRIDESKHQLTLAEATKVECQSCVHSEKSYTFVVLTSGESIYLAGQAVKLLTPWVGFFIAIFRDIGGCHSVSR